MYKTDYKKDYKKVVVKFYNCIKQIIKKLWLNFIYSELELRQLKPPLLMYIMVSESSSLNVNYDDYNWQYLHIKTVTTYTMFKTTGVAAGSVKPPHKTLWRPVLWRFRKPPQTYIAVIINACLYKNNRHNIHFFL